MSEKEEREHRGHDPVKFNDDEDDEEEEESSVESSEDEEEEEDDDVSDVSDEDDILQYLGTDHYDEEALPEYACRYCGIHDPSTVAKCVTSGKWFCNGGSPSHLVHHLVKSRSHAVQLHADSPLGDSVLECYNCGSQNVFVLGFVPAGGGNAVVVLLCRVCVDSVPALRDMEWELSAWHPLVQERQFVSWLLSEPAPALMNRAARKISAQEMTQLEEVWKANPEASYRDLQSPEENVDALPPILKVYEDGYHYQNVVAPLVQLEGDYDKQMKENWTQGNINVRWSKALNGAHVASFTFRQIEAHESKIVVGDELRLVLGPGGEFLNGGPWEGVGYVKNLWDGTVDLEFVRTVTTVPSKTSDDFRVEYIWKSTTYDRMQNALKTFAVDDASVTGYIYHKLLGHTVEEQRIATAKIPHNGSQVPGLPPLNESQWSAVQAVLQRPLSLIQGPPGTGKTVTSATLVYHLVQQPVGKQVLVTAPSNVAVDQLTEKIAATGLRVVRLASKTREAVTSSVDPLCLHIMTPLAAGDEYAKLQRLKDEIGELSARDQKKYRQIRSRTERQILQAADVICTTCSGAGDPRLSNLRFRQVLIDEATQAIEAEALIPIAMGAKQVVFVGDHCQLGPVVMCKAAAKAGLTQSLFERLVLIGNRPIRLQVQYRMHPSLSEFPSNMFYEGSLQNGVTESDRQLLNMPEYSGKEDFPWPQPDKPMFFYSVTGMEEISSSGTSYLNRTEASYVEKCVTHLLRMGVTPVQIGVITPYDGQKKYVSDYMRRAGALSSSLYENIEVASVDAFQGREKDFILVSCVRSSETQGIGFLSDPRRLNVALTRARLGIILLGNPRVLSKNALWAALLLHFKEHECLVEGTLTNLQPSYMTFARPKQQYLMKDSRYAFTALARGGWDGRWEDNRRPRDALGFGRRNGGGVDSRYDTRYKDVGMARSDVPIPSFAPLPAYNDEQSLDGDSQYGGSRASFYTQPRDDGSKGGNTGFYVSGGGGYGYGYK